MALNYVETVPDPGFDDPQSWEIAGAGGTVTGSSLVLINATIASGHPLPWYSARIGTTYRCTVTILYTSGSPFTGRWSFGGEEFWNQSTDGYTTGSYTKTITATTVAGLAFVGINTGRYEFTSISIEEQFTVFDDGEDKVDVGQPPPRFAKEFTNNWKDWLWFLYKKLSDFGSYISSTSVSGAYSIKGSDQVILADPTVAGFTVTLPEGVNKRMVYIKNITTSTANQVTIDGFGSETIDGNTTFILDPLESAHVLYSEAESGWYII